MVADNSRAWAELKDQYPFPSMMPQLDVNIKGWRTWREHFVRRLGGRNNPIILEVGSWFGKNVLELLELVPDCKIISVDTWEGGPEHQEGELHYQPELGYLYEQFIRNVWDYRDRVLPIRALSWDGMEEVAKAGLEPDLVYIDAGHTFDCVFKDLETATRLFGSSIICGDDYDWVEKNEVREVVERFCAANSLEFSNFERFWWLDKPVGPGFRTNPI